ncbi:MBL fold metallo-hydrolase [Acidicapsa ligni]|uniref:MBL fold metallo-hydrolase n=1 Tax=Acidicapsa ligni TaxID=542300 RepID=UPI0021E00163|nr:MBL fold metallo-hydrolase [Acidicapsa ligni]
MHGTLTFLGTGTSMGVPSLGCGCDVCTSTDPHDKRLRPSILLRWACADNASAPKKPRVGKGLLPFPPAHQSPCERVVLIDTGPDFRTQALNAGIKRVDAVFYTHSHADHILGMDDLRPLSFATYRESGPIPLYVTPETQRVLEHIYDYTFSPDSKYANKARVELKNVSDGAQVHEVRFIPVPVLHGELPITGYRFGNVAYLTDVSTIPEASFALLQGLDVLVVSALRHAPHPSHATVDQAVRWAKRIGAQQTWLTHISHDLGHEETNARLPKGIAMAYDGLTLPVVLA